MSPDQCDKTQTAEGDCLDVCPADANTVAVVSKCACYNYYKTTYYTVYEGKYCLDGYRDFPFYTSGLVELDRVSCVKEKVVECTKGNYCYIYECYSVCESSLKPVVGVSCVCGEYQTVVNANEGQACYNNQVYKAQDPAEVVSVDNAVCVGENNATLCASGNYCDGAQCKTAEEIKCAEGVIKTANCLCGETMCRRGNSCVAEQCVCAPNTLIETSWDCMCGGKECATRTEGSALYYYVCLKDTCMVIKGHTFCNPAEQAPAACFKDYFVAVDAGKCCVEGIIVEQNICEMSTATGKCVCSISTGEECDYDAGQTCHLESGKCVKKCVVGSAALTESCLCFCEKAGIYVILQPGDYCKKFGFPLKPVAYSVCSGSFYSPAAGLPCHCGTNINGCAKGTICVNNECVSGADKYCEGGYIVEKDYCLIPDNLYMTCAQGVSVTSDYWCKCPVSTIMELQNTQCKCGGSSAMSGGYGFAQQICVPEVSLEVHPICNDWLIQPFACICNAEKPYLVPKYGNCSVSKGLYCEKHYMEIDNVCKECPAICVECDYNLKCTKCSFGKSGPNCSNKTSGYYAAIIVPCVIVALIIVGVVCFVVLRKKNQKAKVEFQQKEKIEAIEVADDAANA